MIKSLPIQDHHLGTKCSNIQDYWGYFTFKQEQGARWQARWGPSQRSPCCFFLLIAL